MTDHELEEEIRAAWDEIYRPAPWLLTRTSTAVRKAAPARRRLGWLAGVAAVLVALSSIAIFESIRQEMTSRHGAPTPINTSLLPQPVPEPITHTSYAAQVAWMAMQAPSVVGVDPTGHVVATLPAEVDSYGVWRSPDGSEILFPESGELTAYSAADGKRVRSYPLVSGNLIADSFSPNGRMFAAVLVSKGVELETIDLATGATQMATMDQSSTTSSGAVVFAPDSTLLYTFTDWETSLRVTAFDVGGGKLAETASAVNGQQGRRYPSCGGPAMSTRVIAGGGGTAVAFCHSDGAVLFFDLNTLDVSGIVQSHQPNPFWLSPIFTPDGQLLYLHQWPAFGDTMQVVDLVHRRLLGPLPTPSRLDEGGLFAGLITNVFAGGIASTQPISPDGLTLYSATPDGVVVLRVPDLKPIRKLAPGFDANEVWVSGDGQTIYASSEDGKSLAVMRADGSSTKIVSIPGLGVGFVASEHG